MVFYMKFTWTKFPCVAFLEGQKNVNTQEHVITWGRWSTHAASQGFKSIWQTQLVAFTKYLGFYDLFNKKTTYYGVILHQTSSQESFNPGEFYHFFVLSREKYLNLSSCPVFCFFRRLKSVNTREHVNTRGTNTREHGLYCQIVHA